MAGMVTASHMVQTRLPGTAMRVEQIARGERGCTFVMVIIVRALVSRRAAAVGLLSSEVRDMGLDWLQQRAGPVNLGSPPVLR
jgi:hypothetical protein